MNALQLCCWRFSHKRNFVAHDFLREKCTFRRNTAILRFERTTYAVYFRLIRKRVVDFLLVVILNFCRKVLRLMRHERKSIENRRFCSNGVSLAQGTRYKGSFPTNHSFCQKTRWIDLLYGIKIFAVDYFALSRCTRLTDKQISIAIDRAYAFTVARQKCTLYYDVTLIMERHKNHSLFTHKWFNFSK